MTEGVNQESGTQPIGASSRLPEGYASFVDSFRELEKPPIVGRLTNLYPEMAALLHDKGQQGTEFKMQINAKYGVVMEQDIRERLLEGLDNGNPKVIAVLAYYVWDKSKGGLPLETIQPRKTCGDRALQLMRDMQGFINEGQEGREAFVAEKVRTDWGNLLSGESDKSAAVVAAEEFLHQER